MENRGGKATRSAKVPSGEPSEDESPTQPNPDLKRGGGRTISGSTTLGVGLRD